MSARPSSANFDVVRIDPDEDAEAVARALSERADVEYAQAAYRVHTAVRAERSAVCEQLQWNLPLIDMERAWDIQPQAGSSIIVAVIDTGVAYTNATVTRTAFAFTDERASAIRRWARSPFRMRRRRNWAPPAGLSRLAISSADSNTPLDFDGHGTHVSGTIGQLTNDGIGTAGVAFGVRLMPIKVIASVWDRSSACAERGGTDDDGGAGHPIRGRQRREGRST